MFVDRVEVEFVAGKGGNGLVSWRREPYLPKGGPWGGNGGPGGSIILKANSQIPSLDSLRNSRIVRGECGQQGGSAKRQGRKGQDLVVEVPCGTLVKDVETGEVICDLAQEGQRLTLCHGGKGGRGNASFRSSRNRSPHFATEGALGDAHRVELELKLIADVGFIGFPNAGKSTLLQSITQVPVKIAPYPFTTLHPNLGYIELEDFTRVLLADIPGLIEGAHRDRGLGFEFLRHIERTRVLVFLLDCSCIDDRDPVSDYKILRAELSAYDEELLDRPSFILLNKIDAEGALEWAARFQEEIVHPNNRLFQISALEGTGVKPFVEALSSLFFTHHEQYKVGGTGE
jgi:GTPase